MSARAARKGLESVSKGSPKARHASITPSKRASKPSDLGREIFIYNHLQTNQVIYSLTKSVKNVHALRQLPYNGKKTVPSALRKDLWAPLAHIELHSSSPASASISSPSSSSSIDSIAAAAGLRIFQKLREYRKLHETLWPESLAVDEKTGRVLSRIERGRKLGDQKANSVADLAAAIKGVTVTDAETGEGEMTKETVKAIVRWKDILDAEFAESWPETVLHDQLVTTRNNRRIKNTDLEGADRIESVDADKHEPGEITAVPPKTQGGKIVL